MLTLVANAAPIHANEATDSATYWICRVYLGYAAKKLRRSATSLGPTHGPRPAPVKYKRPAWSVEASVTVP